MELIEQKESRVAGHPGLIGAGALGRMAVLIRPIEGHVVPGGDEVVELAEIRVVRVGGCFHGELYCFC
jgi:hypothetical protein